MSVEIKEVTNNKELKQFVKFNLELYKGNPYHVPGLIEEEMMTLDKEKNPAFEVCDAILFLAYKDGKIVGRIAGIINRGSNAAWEEKRARFGFVDFVDDAEVVDALFDAVIRWAKEHGMSVNAWTVDKENDMNDMFRLGTDMLTTDEPALARTLLGERERKAVTGR